MFYELGKISYKHTKNEIVSLDGKTLRAAEMTILM